MNSILFVGSFLSKHQGTLGVSESLAKEISEKGFNVTTCSQKKNKGFRFLEIFLSCIFCKYDILHIDVFSGASFRIAELASLIGTLRRKKNVLTLHGGMLPEFYLKNGNRIQKVFNRAKVITSPSNYLVNFFSDKGIIVKYIPNSIDLNRFPFNKDVIRDQSLLWVRAFSDIYCPEVVIESFKLVREKFPEAKLTMVGPDKGKLKFTKDLIEQYGLSTFVTITGPVPNDLLCTYYQKHAVFLNTTRYESFGNCVLEAASCGIPIVSNKVGELPFIWEDNCNIQFVPNNSPAEFDKKISLLFDDASLTAKMKHNARIHAEKFERESIINQWIQLFSK